VQYSLVAIHAQFLFQSVNSTSFFNGRLKKIPGYTVILFVLHLYFLLIVFIDNVCLLFFIYYASLIFLINNFPRCETNKEILIQELLSSSESK